MKDFFKKTWVKVIGYIALFFAILLLMSNCQKVDAANFTLTDGTISDVKYNENQTLEGSSFTLKYNLTITKNLNYYYFYLTSYNTSNNSSELNFSTNCTRTDDHFTCEKDYYVSSTTSSMNSPSTISEYYIYDEYISRGTGLFSIKFYPVKTYDEGYNAGIAESNASYEEGYQAGIDSVDITVDNLSYAEQYITTNHYHSNQEYLDYGETKYQEGIDSVDITADNESAIQSYIAINNMKTEVQYLQYGTEKYNQGYQAGVDSVDITTDNQSYAEQYITTNHYHSDQEYIDYGETKYQAGVDSVDITADNESAIQSYIAVNNMKTEAQYLQYGTEKYNQGYQAGVDSVDITVDNLSYALQYIEDNNYYSAEEVVDYYDKGQRNVLYDLEYYIYENYDKNYSIDYLHITDGNYKEITNKMSNDIFNYGYNSYDVNKYITDNNYHTDTEYLEYGNSNYTNGKYEGYNFLMDEIIEWLYQRKQENAYLHLLNNHVDMNNTNINEYANGFEGIHEVNRETYMDTLVEIENVGYVQAMEDSDAFLGLIPTTIGAVIGNAMPILTYEVYGISLMNLIGLIAIIGVAIIIVKFIVG